tara:strand:- start:8384 stop:9535 length:1152 start_codon:yes stop_codon:yes gene_type:complete
MNFNIAALDINKFSSYVMSLFIVSLFLDRHLANLILIVLIILLLFRFTKEREHKSYKHIYISSFIFVSIIFVISFIYHDAPISYIDNFFRFIILLPLLYLRYNERILENTIILSSFAALYHYAILTDNYDVRYAGTSSTSITYGHLITLLMCINTYLLLFRNHKSVKKVFLFLSIIIFLYLYTKNQTLGALLGIFLFLILAIIKSKNRLLVSSLTVLLMFIIIQSPLGERLNTLKNNMNNIDKSYLYDSTSNKSLRERILFGVYAFDITSNFPFTGIGPQNIIEHVRSFMLEKKYAAEKNPHLHNDFFDIAAKYGVLPLIALFYFYITLFIFFKKDKNTLGLIVLLFFITANISQSQLAHHQSTIFFISMLYLLTGIYKKNTE